MRCCLCGGDAGEYGNNAMPIKDGRCCDLCNDTKVLPLRLNIGMGVHFVWIGSTHSSKSYNLDRWECPICREDGSPECRFNLSSKKRGSIWKCRFCGNYLKLNKEDLKK